MKGLEKIVSNDESSDSFDPEIELVMFAFVCILLAFAVTVFGVISNLTPGWIAAIVISWIFTLIMIGIGTENYLKRKSEEKKKNYLMGIGFIYVGVGGDFITIGFLFYFWIYLVNIFFLFLGGSLIIMGIVLLYRSTISNKSTNIYQQQI